MNSSSFFSPYYNNAKVNSILIMNCKGVILDVNQAFTKNFSYSNEDLRGLNFSVLFNEDDRRNKVPELELRTVEVTGQAHDENYIINKEGNEVWALGESLLVSDPEGEKYIVKDIINLETKRQMEFFLTETEELLERIFEFSKEVPMMILDGGMKILKVNKPFLNLFEITDEPLTGSRLSNLSSNFWQNADIRREISAMIIKNQPLRNRKFALETLAGEKKILRFDSRIVDSKAKQEKKIFITIEDLINA